MNSEIIKRLEDLGECRQRLKEVLNNELWKDLSKHNPYWDSEDDSTADKLYDIRCSLSWVEERLWDVFSLLQGNKEDEL